MPITAEMVRELRDETGAPMMDCKKALEATGGDKQQAVDHLRKAGLKSAEKKASRSMGEGRVHAALSDDGKRGAMVAVTCETDFLARSDDFGSFVTQLGEHVLEHKPTGLGEGDDPLLSQTWGPTDTPVPEAIKEVIGSMKENISVAQVQYLESADGLIGSYVHHDGKQGAIVSVTTGASKDDAAAALKSLCQHVVVFKPVHLDREQVSADAVEREKAIYREEVKGKPEEIQDKIIAGKLEKYFAQTVLLEQPWIHDDKSSVQKALVAELGEGTKVESFHRFKIGE